MRINMATGKKCSKLNILKSWLSLNTASNMLSKNGYIWPKIINSHIAHIADIPSLRFTGREKLFPIENPDGSFVGEPFEYEGD